MGDLGLRPGRDEIFCLDLRGVKGLGLGPGTGGTFEAVTGRMHSLSAAGLCRGWLFQAVAFLNHQAGLVSGRAWERLKCVLSVTEPGVGGRCWL